MVRKIALGAGAALLLLLAVGYGGLVWYGAASSEPGFFEDDIAAFEAEDRAGRVAPGAVIFVGSSSIRMWDSLHADMAPLRVIQRGFGGSQMEHALHFGERILGDHRPSAVVVYEGDNDLAASTGKTPSVVLDEFQRFVALVRARAPGAHVYFLTIKPSRLRWDRWPVMHEANEAIGAWAATQPDVDVIDVATPLLGPEGEPRDDVFVFDGLHLNATGYAAWAEVVRPRLLADLAGTAALPQAER